MSARIVIFLLSLVLLGTGFPAQKLWGPDARVLAELQVVEGKTDLEWDVKEAPVKDHHLDEQPAQHHAEGGADLSELIPARSRGMAPSRRIGWEGSPGVLARVSPHLDGPQRPPDTARVVV